VIFFLIVKRRVATFSGSRDPPCPKGFVRDHPTSQQG
jgi:hypothetical protein